MDFGSLEGLDPGLIIGYVQSVLGLGGGLLATVFGISTGIIMLGFVIKRVVGGILSAAGVRKGGKVDGYSD